MGESSSRTFYQDSGRVYGRQLTGFAVIVAAIGVFVMFAPLRWPGTSLALAIVAGLVIVALAVALFRWARRLRRVALVARADGVTILGPLHDHELRWDQIRSFTPGMVSAVSAFRGEIPVVVAELVDGRRIAVEALRVDYGRFKNADAEARVRQLCDQIERCRPASQAPTPGPARGQLDPV